MNIIIAGNIEHVEKYLLSEIQSSKVVVIDFREVRDTFRPIEAPNIDLILALYVPKHTRIPEDRSKVEIFEKIDIPEVLEMVSKELLVISKRDEPFWRKVRKNHRKPKRLVSDHRKMHPSRFHPRRAKI